MLLDSIPGVTKVVDPNHPLSDLWRKYGQWESEQSNMFTTRLVQRQDEQDLRASAGINVPELCTLLQLSDGERAHFHLKHISDILIRDDYLKALSDICYFSAFQVLPETSPHIDATKKLYNPFLDNIQSKRCAVMLLGHPGIGKSIWLIVVLVLRVLAGFPTIYQRRHDKFFIFDANGLYLINIRTFEFQDSDTTFCDAISPHYWCLVDCNRGLPDIPTLLADTSAFILQAASP